jgi:hypothetical protein
VGINLALPVHSSADFAVVPCGNDALPHQKREVPLQLFAQRNVLVRVRKEQLDAREKFRDHNAGSLGSVRGQSYDSNLS